jgi:hypothetical protein
VTAAEQADDLEVVLDPDLAMADLIGDIASEMVRAVAAARTPLDAELAVSPVLGLLGRMAPEDATPGQPATMVLDFLTGLIDWAQLGGGVKDCWIAEGRQRTSPAAWKPFAPACQRSPDRGEDPGPGGRRTSPCG